MFERFLYQLDKLYYSFKRAVKVFKEPDLYRQERDEHRNQGYEIAKAKVKYGLGQHAPDDFKSEEFRLGYLYAQGVVQKWLP